MSRRDPRYIEVLARIRAARQQRGITQKNLARSIGKPQSFMSKVENGERRLDVVELLEVAEVLGVPLHDLLPGAAIRRGTLGNAAPHPQGRRRAAKNP
ncbi:MAG: helix-turn-helix transcriptional regulator [Chloroflexi bacterium]|nr:helix-turn-helix transcriptional regulator [Chloroflexota bacterium]